MPSASPNALAYLALLLWPLISLGVFRALGPRRGLMASLLGGYLLLPPSPAGFDLPGLPDLNKDTIPAYAALAICLLCYRTGLQFMPISRMARLLLAMYFIGQFLTILTNARPVFWGSFYIPGMRLQEGLSIFLGQLAVVAPLLLGRALLSREEDIRDLLAILLLGTVAYSFPMLVEVRLSPQINTWVYGYFQHSFEQMMRDGGFRPIVFLYHGLWVAFLTATAVLAACALVRGNPEARARSGFAAVWLFGVLILCKSLASLIYVIALAPLVLLGSARLQIRLAVVIGLFAVTYPVLRGVDLVPTQAIVDLAERIKPERAHSLEFRFTNEQVLLERARQKPFFGWGGWGRNLVHEPNTGRILTVPDGRWIVAMGGLGWVGFGAEFGLLVLPILLIWWKGRTAPPRVVAGAVLILAINLLDMIPNATLTPLTWMFAGALIGWAERPQTVAGTLAPKPPRQIMPVLIGAGPWGSVRTVM